MIQINGRFVRVWISTKCWHFEVKQFSSNKSMIICLLCLNTAELTKCIGRLLIELLVLVAVNRTFSIEKKMLDEKLQIKNVETSSINYKFPNIGFVRTSTVVFDIIKSKFLFSSYCLYLFNR